MRNLILFIISSLMPISVLARQGNSADTLKFNQRYTQCEKKWVVLSKADTANDYSYGYIYIDSQAGFTYQLAGKLKIDAGGKYVGDTSIFTGTSVKYRIAPTWKNVALLPAAHFKELNIKGEPHWVKNYYTYTDTVLHNYRWGWIYNDLHQCDIALIYLLDAYKRNPEFNGLEFEIVFAYNELRRHDDAISFLEASLKRHPDNVLSYRELGYAYLNKGEYDKAIYHYKQGIEKCSKEQADVKSEMAFNMADAYKKAGNEQENRNWLVKAKEWAPPGSAIYNHLIKQGL
ncbi:MAG: tetratricopeptide repeat protein [Mucilaginibacter sp.]